MESEKKKTANDGSDIGADEIYAKVKIPDPLPEVVTFGPPRIDRCIEGVYRRVNYYDNKKPWSEMEIGDVKEKYYNETLVRKMIWMAIVEDRQSREVKQIMDNDILDYIGASERTPEEYPIIMGFTLKQWQMIRAASASFYEVDKDLSDAEIEEYGLEKDVKDQWEKILTRMDDTLPEEIEDGGE